MDKPSFDLNKELSIAELETRHELSVVPTYEVAARSGGGGSDPIACTTRCGTTYCG